MVGDETQALRILVVPAVKLNTNYAKLTVMTKASPPAVLTSMEGVGWSQPFSTFGPSIQDSSGRQVVSRGLHVRTGCMRDETDGGSERRRARRSNDGIGTSNIVDGREETALT